MTGRAVIMIAAAVALLGAASVGAQPHGARGGAVGVTLGAGNGEIVVESVMSGRGADRAGVDKGDVIIAINGIAVHGKSVDDAEDMLAGSVGTEVALTVKNAEGSEHSVAIMRESVIEPADPGLPLAMNLPKPHDLRPEDGMVCTIAGATGRTVTIDCGENAGIDRGQAVRFMRREDYARHTALARGTVAKVEEHTAQVNVAGTISGLTGSDVVAITSAWRSERARENTLWRVTAYGIHLLDYPSGKPYATIDQLRFDVDLKLEQAAVTMMATRLKRAADVAPQGHVRGRSIASVLRDTTPQDVMAFLKFLVTYPDNYIGRAWYLPEVYATWLINGSPHAD